MYLLVTYDQAVDNLAQQETALRLPTSYAHMLPTDAYFIYKKQEFYIFLKKNLVV